MPVSQINSNSLASGVPARSNMPAGSVLQVVQAIKTDTFSLTGDFTTVTGLSISITPQSASSKILIIANIQIDSTVGYYTNPWRLARNSSPIFVGDAAGNRRSTTGNSTSQISSGPSQGTHQAAMYLDSPATTSAITYAVQVASYTNSAGVTYINRGSDDTDNISHSRSASSIIVMEIAG
jgi:hypothetical protein